MVRVLIPLAAGCEELEAVTVIDILRRGGIEVTSAGLGARGTPVRASRGTVLVPDTDLDDALKQDYDMVVLPGGLPGANHLNDDPRIRELLQRMARQEKYIAAICAAPKVLADAGLLKGRRATCYPGALNARQLDGVNYQESPVVQDGTLITSRGPGTALDFALVLLETLAGKVKRDEVETSLIRPMH